MPVYVGVNGVVKNIGALHTCVGSVFKTIDKGHVGVSGVNKQFFPSVTLNDLNRIVFKVQNLTIYKIEHDRDADTCKYTHIVTLTSTNGSGFTQTDVLNAIATIPISSKKSWRIAFSNTGLKGTPDWYIIGTGNNDNIAKIYDIHDTNIQIALGEYQNSENLYPDIRLAGRIIAVLNNGEEMWLSEFLKQSNVTSVSAPVGAQNSCLAAYSNHWFFSAHIADTNFLTGDYTTDVKGIITTLGLEALKKNDLWGLSLGVIWGSVTTSLIINNAFNNSSGISVDPWTFTDSAGNTRTFDKTKVVWGFN